jgi:excisionase family DNA binding protein
VEWLSAAQAAGELGVSKQRVRRLAQAGLLPAERLGSVWLVSAAAVRDRARAIPVAGRPLSAPMAWAVVMVVDAALRDPRETHELHLQHALREIADRKVRHQLRSLLAAAPAPDRWAHWLARRASRVRVWVHPGVLDRLVADVRLRPGGGFAAAARGAGIAAAPPRRFYVDENDVAAVLEDYQARHDDHGEIELMVIPRNVRAAFRPPAGEPVPLTIALADLLESADAREHHIATELLDPARAALRSWP